MEATRSQNHGVPRPGATGLTRVLVRLGHVIDRVELLGANWHRLVVAVGLIAPLLLLYRALLFTGGSWLDFDLLLSYQPRYRLLAEGLADGRIPLWTEGILGGFPVAFSEFGWFYPLTWGLLRVFDPLQAYFFETALGLVLAAAAAHGLGRVWGLSRRSAFLAAFLYAYGPFVFATSRFLNYADIFFVLPAGLIAIERIAQGRRRWTVALAVITGITALAGHPQVALLFVTVWLIYTLFRLVWTWREKDLLAAGCLGGWLLIAVVVGLALGAVRLLPTIETTSLSARAGGLDFETAAQGSVAPWNLALGYLHPSFEIPRVLNESINAEELLYLGLLTPLLALLALIVGWRHRVVRFLALVVAFAWLLAMGSYSLGFPLIQQLPLFGFFRQPARFGLVASFGIAFLAAFGFEMLRQPGMATGRPVALLARAWTWLAGLLTVGTLAATIVLTGFAFLIVPYGYDFIDREIVGSEGRFLTAERYYRTFDQLYARLESAFSLAGSTPRQLLVVTAVGVVVIRQYRRGALRGAQAQMGFGALLAADLLLAPGHSIPTVPEAWQSGHQPPISESEQSRGGRLFSYRAQAQKFELSTVTGDRLSRDQRMLLEWIFLKATYAPNLALDAGPATIDGYENLMPQTTARFLAYVGSERATVSGFATDTYLDEESRLALLQARVGVLGSVNVRYITSGVPLPIEGLRELSKDLVELPTWAGVEQPLFVYELERWQPSVWVARDWTVVDMSGDLDLLLDQFAAMPERPLVSRDPGIPRAQAKGGSDVITPVVREPESLEVGVDLASPGVVVINEALSPGWIAAVDGQPAELLEINMVARGIALPAGAHQITMRFEPPGLAGGVIVSLAATGLLVPLLAVALWRERL